MEGELTNIQALLDFLKAYGLYGVLLIIIILVVHNPDRVTQLKAVFLSPVYRWLRIGGKQYIAAHICYTVTHFFRNQLSGVCRLSTAHRIKLRWVT